ncbi:hypothetical protein [Herbiconiux sp. YIM B11900]|uniref:hypothetical protein n=1 Tax=Herbiconiux sp. YIM B11900 TaxID=3404131 RepID=UPI003F87DFC5
MAQRVYATASDYEDLAEEPFQDPGENDARLNKRLRSASIEIESLTRLALYATDDDGYPTDPDISDAFTEATVAVAEYWEGTGDSMGVDANAGAVSIGSVSLGTTSSRVASGDETASRTGRKALTILRNAGLSNSLGY